MGETLSLATLQIGGAEQSVASGLEPIQFTGLPDDEQPLEINVVCNTDAERLHDNVRLALKRGIPAIEPIEPHGRVAVICGGGPSLAGLSREVGMWQLARGADVFALNGACGHLNDIGVLPTFQIILDPRVENTKLKGMARSYLLASQCAPEMFEAVAGYGTTDEYAGDPIDIGLFHSAGSAAGIATGTLIGGDITVGLSALNLVYTLGYRELHLYGYDSSCADDDGRHHAYRQDQTPQEERRIKVKVRDENDVWREFTTSMCMAKQAELFPKAAELLINAGASIAVHGDGLIPTIWRKLVADHNLNRIMAEQAQSARHERETKQAAMPILDAAE